MTVTMMAVATAHLSGEGNAAGGNLAERGIVACSQLLAATPSKTIHARRLAIVRACCNLLFVASTFIHFPVVFGLRLAARHVILSNRNPFKYSNVSNIYAM